MTADANTDTDTDTPAAPGADARRQWHRLFGIALTELFAGAPWRVDVERELALRSQLLDVAIIETTATDAERRLPADLPDGLDNLRAHNLLTYKSRHEPLDVWALDELTAHYVNYRKLALDARERRHPPDAFGLYAVATRGPRTLDRAQALQPTAWSGVHDLPWGGHVVRVIVLNDIAPHPRNAPWELFASERERLRQGLIHYRARYPHPIPGGHWALLERLHLLYQREAPDMAYTMEEFLRETHELVIAEAIQRDPDAILKRFAPEDVLGRYAPEQRLRGLDPATIEAWLAKQRRDR